jgi:hypothetical protein
MNGIVAIKQGVLARVLEHFSDELDDDRCKIADTDAIFKAIFMSSEKYFGCVLDNGPAREMVDEVYKKQHWAWQIWGVFFIQYNDDIEVQADQIIDKLAVMFAPDHTLGGLSPKVKMVEIGIPEPNQVNDVAFYFIPFVVEAWDR